MDASLQALLATTFRSRGAPYQASRDALLESPPAALAEVEAWLQAWLGDPSWETQLTAGALLGWLADRSTWMAVAAYSRGELTAPMPVQGYTASVRGGAIAALGPKVVPRILELVYKASLPADEIAVAALFTALMVLRDPRAIPVMITLLWEPAPDAIQRAAIRVLAATRHAQALDPVLAVADDTRRDPTVRAAAIAGLGRFRDPRATRTLLAIIASEARSPIERKLAAHAIGEGADPVAAAEVIVLFARERDAEIALALILALGEIGTAVEIPLLESLAAQAEPRLSRPIADSIQEIRLRALG